MSYHTTVTQFNRLVAMNTLLTQAAMTTYLRRQLHGPRRATWSWYFESLVELMNAGTPSAETLSAQDIRAALDRVDLDALPLPAEVTLTPATAGGVPALWFDRPQGAEDRVVLYLHGGGYVSGSPFTHRHLIAEVGRVCRMRVLALDYRLAPEAPFPAALEDAWTAYWWLLAQGYAAERIVIGGDSAGGGLGVALLVALRDAGVPQPAAAFGLSPWFDLSLSGLSVDGNHDSDYLNRNVLARSAEFYLNGHDARDPLASPLYADLHDLAPLLIQAGTAEMLLDDARRFAKRATAADAVIEFEPWENMIHVWHFLFLLEPQARLALEHLGRFVREYVEPGLRPAGARHGPVQ
jgi:acetyl esterase/lipase